MNRGAALLERKRAAEGLGFEAVAAALEVSVRTARRLCSGEEPCKKRLTALAAFRFAGIPVSAWDDPVPVGKNKP